MTTETKTNRSKKMNKTETKTNRSKKMTTETKTNRNVNFYVEKGYFYITYNADNSVRDITHYRSDKKSIKTIKHFENGKMVKEIKKDRYNQTIQE